MRLSVGDKGANDARVFLNGNELKHCIMADEEKGEVVCAIYPLEKDETGERIKIETLKGVVKVVL